MQDDESKGKVLKFQAKAARSSPPSLPGDEDLDALPMYGWRAALDHAETLLRLYGEVLKVLSVVAPHVDANVTVTAATDEADDRQTTIPDLVTDLAGGLPSHKRALQRERELLQVVAAGRPEDLQRYLEEWRTPAEPDPS